MQDLMMLVSTVVFAAPYRGNHCARGGGRYASARVHVGGVSEGEDGIKVA